MCYVVYYINFLLQSNTLKQIMQYVPTLTKISQIQVLFYFVLFCLQKVCFQTNLFEPALGKPWVLSLFITLIKLL